MINASEIREHAEVVGSDGQHVGTVDRVEGGRIKLTKSDSHGAHAGHHHFIDMNLVQSVDGGRVQLSVAGREAVASEQEQSGRSVN
ncbi:DUF2171 domain-containing protein [Gellertiella hungarica]|uniref:DUF2171 domain-containing protein n=1 Tax=Gellertiella hungarica TaxID=1572859 RepID=A0A7W6NN86_9HYPH|nr:DUF2171 domain-containing protein [Gellertiella hungarica]MBB4067210.1 hypothetical protein [Gellertiella hungarica]